MQLYAYWEGADRHWFYDACWKTVLHHNPTAKLLSKKDVEDVLGKLPACVEEAYITHRCDWIRKAFIHAVGGAWVDMDFICCRPLDFLVEQAKVFDYVGYKEWNGGWMDNFFAGRKGSPVLESAANYALNNIRRFGRNIAWLGASTEAIDFALKEHPWSLHCQLPSHIVTPYAISNPNSFTEVSDAPLSHACLGYMASMHTLRGAFNKDDKFARPGMTSLQGVLDGNTRLGEMLRRSGAFDLSPAEGGDYVAFDWAAVKPTHIPAAMRSENIGDDVQTEAASRLWGVTEYVERDDPESWPDDAVVPLIGWWGRGAPPSRDNFVVVGFHLADIAYPALGAWLAAIGRAVKKQGFPAQCRDLRTRNELRAHGIPADFSGCVSLTLSSVPSVNSQVVKIDHGKVCLTNCDDELRRTPHGSRVAQADERIKLMGEAGAVVTTRLHAWLPSLALGTHSRLSMTPTLKKDGRATGYNTDATTLSGLFPKGPKPARYRTVPGFFGYGETYRTLVERMPDGGTFVEVGVYAGRSLCFAAEYMKFIGKSGRCVGYDLFEKLATSKIRPSGVNFLEVSDLLAGLNAEVHQMDSVAAADRHEDKSVDVVFIDGDHSAEGVARDLRAWLPKVKDGGILCGHDIDFASVRHGLKVAGVKWTELRDNNCWIADDDRLRKIIVTPV